MIVYVIYCLYIVKKIDVILKTTCTCKTHAKFPFMDE